MADTIILGTDPPLRAFDNGDGTYSVAVIALSPAAGTDTVFIRTSPSIKAVDNGDDTYLLSLEVVS